MFLLVDLLARAKQGAGVKTDYKLAKAIGVTQASVSMWRIGRSFPNDAAMVKLCELSRDDAGVFCVQLAAHRAPDELTRLMWQSVEFRLKKARQFDVQEVRPAIEKVAA
jgi:transcriptional regulator with XRE-family HTH domain